MTSLTALLVLHVKNQMSCTKLIKYLCMNYISRKYSLLGPKNKVVVRGYQLTRQQVTRNLCSFSVIPERRFEELDPIVCEMWHSKHDVMEMCAVSYDMHCELLYQKVKKCKIAHT